MSKPSITLNVPEPSKVQKQFHGKKLLVWEGAVHIDSVQGWVSNRRLDLEVRKFRDLHAGRDPDNDEIYGIMKTVKDFKLKGLADDIRVNSVRIPIILATDGRLLDGNRRYYALRLILDGMNEVDPVRSEFERVPAWVLDESCTPEDEDLVLVQENFYASLKVEWPHYVKAQRIYEELQRGYPIPSVAQRYGWRNDQVNETKRIMELIEDFLQFATTEPDEEIRGLGVSDIESERIAAENYQNFNQAQRSFRVRLEKDLDFKESFFEWIYKGKFTTVKEVEIAEAAWDDEKARKILMDDDEPKAGRRARALIDYQKNFHKVTVKAEEEIEGFVRFLSELTTAQKQNISGKSLKELEAALSTVIQMIKSSNEEANG